MLEAVLVVLLILVFFMVAYKGAVHEFQILQKDWKPTIDWSALLSEQLPLVLRNVDPSWQGAWTYKATAGKTWPIQVRRVEGGALFKGRWNEWIAAPPGQPALTPETQQEISTVVDVPLAAWEDGGFRRWSWVPAHMLRAPRCGVLGAGDVLRVRRTIAAATVLMATDGAPMTLWLAHEGAIPAKVVGAIVGKNPWSLHVDQVPWISEVKFIEMRLRPGNAVSIPTHWYWAAKTEAETGVDSVSSASSMGEGSWYWEASWHTPISWLVSAVRKN